MPLVENQTCYLQPNSEIMLDTTNLNHNLQPISRKTSNIFPEETKVPLDENQSGNRHFLAETPLTTDTIANFSQNKSVQDPLFPVKN
jgi:hypothetical protein